MNLTNPTALFAIAAAVGAFFIGVVKLGGGASIVIPLAVAVFAFALAGYALHGRPKTIAVGLAVGAATAGVSTFPPLAPVVVAGIFAAIFAIKALDDE